MSELVLTLLELMKIHGAFRPCALWGGGRCWPSIFSCLSRNCLQVIDCGALGTTFPHGQLHASLPVEFLSKARECSGVSKCRIHVVFIDVFMLDSTPLFKCGMSII